MANKAKSQDNKSQDNQNNQFENLSPTSVQKCLKGVDYPATKQELVEHAEGQGADDEVLEFLQNLPDNEEFSSPIEVMKHFRETKGKAAS